MKKKISVVTLLSLSLALMIQCLVFCEPISQETSELWVVTETSNSDGMNLQAEIIAERMEEENPGLSVILEILPIEKDEREIRLKQLRTKIMSGDGPDVYLLPTGGELISDEPERDQNIPIVPLFSDVQQAMRNGIFRDISELFASSIAIKSCSLNQDIMDAGVINGKRYVLPLRYDVPVIYTCPNICAEYNLTETLFLSDFLTVAQTILSSDNAEHIAVGLKFPENLEILGRLLDYEHGKVLLTEQNLADYMQLYQFRHVIGTKATQEFYEKWEYLRRPYSFTGGNYSDEMWDFYNEVAWPQTGQFHHECFNLLSEYTMENYHWLSCDLPLYTGYLSDVLETIGVSRLTDRDVQIYPLRSLDGSIQAEIAYWGAIGSSCEDPTLAFEYLCRFLDIEFQGDIYRPRGNREGAYWTWDSEPQAKRQVEDSLPVRVKDCVPYLWDNLQYQIKTSMNSSIKETLIKIKTIQRENVEKEHIPALNWEIDYVYFPIIMSQDTTMEYAMNSLNHEDGTPTDADIDELAREVYQDLWWHLAEG